MKYRVARVTTVREFFEFEAPNEEIARRITNKINDTGEEPDDFELIATTAIDSSEFELIGKV